jgi:hypothetical protein
MEDEIFLKDQLITYLGNKYILDFLFNNKNQFGFSSKEFDKAFKHKYVKYGRELGGYLFDKTMEFCKKNNIDVKKKVDQESD